MYGGALNSASVIGKFGNPYGDYIAAFSLPVPNTSLNLIPVTGNAAISAPVPSGFGSNVPDGMAGTGPAICEICKTRKVETRQVSHAQPILQASHPSQGHHPSRALVGPPLHQRRTSNITKLAQTGGRAPGRIQNIHAQRSEAEEEGFMDVLKTVTSALPAGLGLNGGGPIGALAGFALNAASKMITETTGAESAMDSPAPLEGSMERAILAEAALSALQSGELSPHLEESIFSDMKDTVMKALPVIRKAAPHVMGAMMEPALQIALNSLHKYNQRGANGTESFEEASTEPFRPNVRYTTAIDQPADHQAEAFLSHLQASLQQNLQESAADGDSEEGFFDIIKAGARFAGKGVLAAAHHGLPILAGMLNQSRGAEAFEDQAGYGSTSQLLAADPLAQRALVADATLKAMMKLPPQQLEEEGFFDFIGGAIKAIAPIAMKVAPVVAGAINPTVGRIVSGVLGQESAFAGESNGHRNATRLAERPGPSARRSLYSLRDNAESERRNRFEQAAADRSQYGSYTRLGTQLNY